MINVKIKKHDVSVSSGKFDDPVVPIDFVNGLSGDYCIDISEYEKISENKTKYQSSYQEYLKKGNRTIRPEYTQYTVSATEIMKFIKFLSTSTQSTERKYRNLRIIRNYTTGILGFYETLSFVLNNQKMMLSGVSSQID